MNRFNLLAILYVSSGALFYGYDSGLSTSIFGYPAFISYFNLNTTTLGAVGSCYYAGNFFGSYVNWYWPDKYGRLRTIRAACAIAVVGAVLQTAARNLAMLLVGRIVGGFACGIIFSLCPAYASEISPPKIRGSVGGLYNLMLSSAYALTEWMGLGLSYVNGNSAWRIFLGLQFIPPALMAAGSLYMPESPRWLLLKRRDDEALEVLRKMHSDPKDPEFYLREFHQIKSQIELERSQNRGFKTIFTKKSYIHRFVLIIAFYTFQQLTGIVPLQNYQVLLYAALGIGNKMSLVLVGVWGMVTIISTCCGTYYFDKIGRKKSFYISITIVMIASTLLTAFWASYEKSGNTNATLGKLGVWSMFLFMFGYAWVMNAFGYAYIPEICPTEIRAAGTATGLATFNAVTVLLVQVGPLAIQAISWRYFLIFLCMDAIFVPLVYFAYPETNGKTLEEIAALFGDEVAETMQQAEEHVHKELRNQKTGSEKIAKSGLEEVDVHKV
ncbi:hypothetical protein Z517_00633 [Fonsecaea pedrosoi CBS 271.37]|uniref:Major facilitator superfamily (MFS) profile domain-containing protein n=1 Tax=Fonsecaea pedrosoi CBS 271.37 TaxID=1442368 RepID=A0A0D2GW65_9EURO|nr:uncharacterized protein Z517_00633 [Fonsecaea pedrosoi CBS 271.37]KIW85243.1 hypothetical protein Z517_00633 [Fonsecaea pedrosoi CBS 271.37]